MGRGRLGQFTICTSHPLPLDHGGGQRDTFSSSLTQTTYLNPGLQASSQTVGYSSRHIAGNISQQETYQLARVDGVSQWHLKGAFALGFVTQIPGYGRVCWTYLWYGQHRATWPHWGMSVCSGRPSRDSWGRETTGQPPRQPHLLQGLGKPLLGGIKMSLFGQDLN